MKLKVCGMRDNLMEVAAMEPDYLGLIFWENSPRYFEGKSHSLPPSIKKAGVFVDASPESILREVEVHGLHLLQLHGSETPECCASLRGSRPGGKVLFPEICKVFTVGESFDFQQIIPFEKSCDYFMFDTRGKLPGGNGFRFNWELLKGYPSQKPYFLSGGIGLAELDQLEVFLSKPEAAKCHAIDVNSKFEIRPGLKEVESLRIFKKRLSDLGPEKKAK